MVTVYIPCRNYGRFLEVALQSLKVQLYKNWELFIIDEASEDDTQIIARHFQLHTEQRVQIIHNTTPVGLQKVANDILRLANGRYIMRLDADDWLDESALLLMVAKLESDLNLGMVYGNYYYVNECGSVIGFERRRKLGVEDTSGHLPPHGACTMVRTRLLKSIGGYSEDINAQDGWELWFKLVKHAQPAALEAPIFYYRQHNKSLSVDLNKLLAARTRIISRTRNYSAVGYQPSCLAVIPVKEENPNTASSPFWKFDGKSLLQIAIQTAQQSTNITNVVISSSSESVFNFADDLVKQKIIKPFSFARRPKEINGPLLNPTEILLHSAENFYNDHGQYPDIVVFLSLHSPLRKVNHIDSAIDVLIVQNCDTVVSVCEEREPIFSHGMRGLSLINPGRFQGVSYDREKLFRFNGSVIATWTDSLKEKGLFQGGTGYIEMGLKESEQIKFFT
jgi:CMP-N-acetylneuraminic acid synthetase